MGSGEIFVCGFCLGWGAEGLLFGVWEEGVFAEVGGGVEGRVVVELRRGSC